MQNSKKTKSGIALLLGATLVYAACFVIFMLLGSIVLYYTEDPLSHSGIAATAAIILAGGAGGFIGAKRALPGGIALPMLGALLFLFLFLLIGVIVSGGRGSAVLITNGCAYLLSALVFSLLGKRRHAGSTAKRRKGARHRG